MKIILTLSFLLLAKISLSQYEIYEQLLTPYLTDSIKSGHFYFITPNNIQAGSLYQFYRTNAPDLNNNMILIEHHTDNEANLDHYKYQQTFMDIPIEGAGCIEHYDSDGSLRFINAKIADSIKGDYRPTIKDETALNYLLAEITKEGTKFAWDDEHWEEQIQSDQNNSSATWYPTPELIWAIDEIRDMNLIIPGNRYTLAYKISITTVSDGLQTIVYYVDANTGAILKSRNKAREMYADVYGYGNRWLDANWHGGFVQKYELIADDGNHNVHTKKYQNTTWNQTDEVRNSASNWGSTYETETSAHFHVTNTWDYFYNTFGWVGPDGNGSEYQVYTQRDYIGAWTLDNQMSLGKSPAGDDAGNDPSIVGHEFTHEITLNSAGLAGEFESGALDESFSDIFGVVIQAQYLDAGSTDWIIGNFINGGTNEFYRSFNNPGSYGYHWTETYDSNGTPIYDIGQPTTYFGNDWCDCPLNVDHGGIHINSSVQNRWFYALTAGTSSFSGIGMTKAARIAYYALTNVLMSSAQFEDSREATIQAAIILFGECSPEHKATVKAWQYVNIFASYNCTLEVDDFYDSEDIELYPNPTSSIVNIQLPKSLDNEITIFDINGKLIQKFDTNQLYFEMDLSSLNKGVYLAHFTINGQDLVKRIVIQ